MYVKLDNENRIIDILNEDIDDRDDLDDEGKTWLHEEFPVYVKNPDVVMETVHYDGRDFIVENNIARFDPLPESIAAMEENEFNERIPDTLDELDEAVCALYEITLYEQSIIDQQDETLCALYEAQLGL